MDTNIDTYYGQGKDGLMAYASCRFGDDVYFFEITGQADGFGISREEIKEFMKD